MAAPSNIQRNPFRRVTLFMQETMAELRKASWPDWSELRSSTILVILTVLIVGGMVAMADFCFLHLIRAVTYLTSGQ